MTSINWSTGETIEISSVLYRVHSRSKLGELNLVNVATSSYEAKSETELAQLWQKGELIRIPRPDLAQESERKRLLEVGFDRFPQDSREAAERRLPYIKAYDDRRLRVRSARVLAPLIQAVAEEQKDASPPSPRQLSRWLKEWYEIGSPDLRDVRCIAPRTHLRGNRTEQFDPDVQALVWDLIEEFILVRTPKPVAHLHGEIVRCVGSMDLTGRDPAHIYQKGLDKGKLRVPSIRTLYRMLNCIDQDVLIRSQKGPIEADRLCQPVQSGPRPTCPLDEVEIDHTLLDIMVFDNKENIAPRRPWLTVAIDRATRMIVGIHVGFEAPSTHTVMLCLRNAIMPKAEMLTQYPLVKGDWPCCGVPRKLILDNGTEFHGKSFKTACDQLKIDPQYCPVRKPRYKGRVERWFGRLARELVHQLPGTTFSNSMQKGDYKSSKKAAISIHTFREILLKWIIEDYSVTYHRGLKDVPKRAWNIGTANHPVSMPANIRDLDTLLSQTESRKLTRKGIELHCLRYCSDADEFRTLMFRADLPPNVMVKVNYDDLSSIKVEDWRTGRYIDVPIVAELRKYTDGLSMAEHKIMLEKARRDLEAYERLNAEALTKCRNEIRQRVAELVKNKQFKKGSLRNAFGQADNQPIKQKTSKVYKPKKKPEVNQVKTKIANSPTLPASKEEELKALRSRHETTPIETHLLQIN